MGESYYKDKGIYYRTNDFKSERPTLVFVHGLVGSSSAWIDYEKKFEGDYNVLTYDIRGHGMSKKFFCYEDYEIKKFAEDLHDLVVYLNISKFVLISHSFATIIAGEYIKNHPESVTAVVFLSPMFGLEKAFTGKILRALLKPTNIFEIFPFNTKPRGHVDYTKHLGSTDWNIKRTIADIRNTTLRVHLYTLRQSLATGQEYLLDKIKVPSLIMHGTKDTMVPVKKAVALSKEIPDAELVLIPNTDHIVVLNNFKEVSEAIGSFLKMNQGVL